jgi:hypothetical protein
VHCAEVGLRFFQVWPVTASFEDDQLRVRDAIVHDLRSRGRRDEVVAAHEDERRCEDLAQADGYVPPFQQLPSLYVCVDTQDCLGEHAGVEVRIEVVPEGVPFPWDTLETALLHSGRR